MDVGRGGPDTYVVSLQQVLKLVACKKDRFPERAYNLCRFRKHFMYCHWKSNVAILQEAL